MPGEILSWKMLAQQQPHWILGGSAWLVSTYDIYYVLEVLSALMAKLDSTLSFEPLSGLS